MKHFVSLREDRDYRYKTRRVVISGLKLVSELSPRFHFRTLLLEEGYNPLFAYKADEVLCTTTQILKKVTGLKNPEPIAAEIDMPDAEQQDLSSVDFLLILDGISDPGNLGTLLRTALALGWQGAFLTTGTTDPFNEKAIRAAKGATFKLPLHSGPWEDLATILRAKKFTLLAADSKGKDLAAVKSPSPPIALVLGNEAHGIALLELKKQAQMIAIPMTGQMESLNVATAGAILMYELRGCIV